MFVAYEWRVLVIEKFLILHYVEDSMSKLVTHECLQWCSDKFLFREAPPSSTLPSPANFIPLPSKLSISPSHSSPFPLFLPPTWKVWVWSSSPDFFFGNSGLLQVSFSAFWHAKMVCLFLGHTFNGVRLPLRSVYRCIASMCSPPLHPECLNVV